MRTTVTDPDVLEVAKALARRRGSRLSSAISELARRGLLTTAPTRKGEHDTVFTVDVDAKAITSEDVSLALNNWSTHPKGRA